MSKSTSITLGDHWLKFIDTAIASGRYGSASEVLRDALRLLEQRDAKLAALRAALVEGEASGSAGALNFAEIKQKARQRAKLVKPE